MSEFFATQCGPLTPLVRQLIVTVPVLCAGPAYHQKLRDTCDWGIPAITLRSAGREQRFAEAPSSNMGQMVEGFTGDLRGAFPACHTLLLVGECFGGLVAYELGLRLSGDGMRIGVVTVDLEGPTERPIGTDPVTLSSDDLRSLLISTGIFDNSITDDPDVWEYFEPLVRSELLLAYNYSPTPGRGSLPLTCITYGPKVPAGLLEAWRRVAPDAQIRSAAIARELPHGAGEGQLINHVRQAWDDLVGPQPSECLHRKPGLR